MSNNQPDMDVLDKKILDILRMDATTTNASIAERIDLSQSAVNERIRKLKENKVIRNIAAFVDAEALNKDLCAFIYVLVDTPINSKTFLGQAIKNQDILECHHITGEYSYLLKVRVQNTKALEGFISDFLKTQIGVQKTHTQIVLSSSKDGSTLVG
jgi:Lrp/AsnC family leucine-responsive transcriptional regulator